MPSKCLHISTDPPFTAQTFSIDYDGAEHFEQSGATTQEIANRWTIAGWFKIADVTTVSGTLVLIQPPAGNTNKIRIHHRHDGIPHGPGAIQLHIAASTGGGTTLQDVSWTSRLSADTWHHIVLQWDGLAATRKFFLDGVDQGAPDVTTTNSDGTQTDTTRQASVAQGGDGVASLVGISASVAVWNTILTASDISTIYNAGSIDFNLAHNSNAYSKARSLMHWWQTGKEVSTDLGKDSGFGTAIDIEAGASGVTDADRVEDVPA